MEADEGENVGAAAFEIWIVTGTSTYLDGWPESDTRTVNCSKKEKLLLKFSQNDGQELQKHSKLFSQVPIRINKTVKYFQFFYAAHNIAFK